jgi:hypothetical protein
MQSSFTLDAETLFRSFWIEALPCDARHVLLACFPKSGSTWLSEILSRLPGFIKADLVPGYDRREQELCFERLLVYHAQNYVAQHHCRYSQATERCLRAFSIKPVILIRNIFDCVVSLRDHIDGGASDPARLIGPTAYIPDDYFGWPEDVRIDFIIDMIVPWYFNFYLGWRDCPDALWVSYEELVRDPPATIRRITDALCLDAKDAAIEHALHAASLQPTRRNVAVIGRGGSLSEKHRQRICQLSSYYPNRDFGPIGLTR